MNGGTIDYAEVQFFFQFASSNDNSAFALVSLYAQPDSELLRHSYGTLCSPIPRETSSRNCHDQIHTLSRWYDTFYTLRYRKCECRNTRQIRNKLLCIGEAIFGLLGYWGCFRGAGP
jgi:hypothetical protein